MSDEKNKIVLANQWCFLRTATVNVLLCHASLYVLGNIRLIDSLKTLVLHKLHKTMSAFQLDSHNAEDIVDLARYAYSEEARVDEGIGGLRGLVYQYMAEKS